MNSRNKTLCLSVIGVMSALSIVLVFFIHIPIFPAVAFLEYDPADIPILICTLLFGPWYGLGMTAVVSLVQGLTVSSASGWIGIVMHFLATGSFVLTAGLVAGRKKMPSLGREIAGLALGVAAMTVTMALWNLLFTPYFMNVTLADLLPLYPFIVAFNLIKAIVNAAVSFAVYKALSPLLKKLKIKE